MNRFSEADKEKSGDYDSYGRYFVFVDSMHKDYNQEPPEPIEQASSSTSPFIGLTPPECYTLLKELHATTKSNFDLNRFGIMDDRSMEDDTVLIVDPKTEYLSVRVEFALAMTAMFCWETGHSTVQEDIDTARETRDNVLRWGGLS